MIKTLKNYIGLKYIADDPVSGRFVNSIPGITTKHLEKISDPEKDTMAGAWADIESNAIHGFESDLINALKRYMKHYTDVLEIYKGQYKADANLPASPEYIGYFIDLRLISQYLKAYVSNISFNLESDQSFDFKVFNLLSGKEIYSRAIEGKEGHNLIVINEEFESTQAEQLFVCVDNVSGGFIPVKDNAREFCKFRKASNASGPVLSQLESAAELPFAISFSVQCSLERYVSNRLNFFTQAYLYKLGLEFLKERQHSDRINRYTLLNKAQAKELQDQLEKDYTDSMSGVLKDMKAPEDGFCFSCNQAVTRVKRIP